MKPKETLTWKEELTELRKYFVWTFVLAFTLAVATILLATVAKCCTSDVYFQPL